MRLPILASRFLFALLLAANFGVARAAEVDPALVAAAKKEGRAVLYTPLIVDQLVRPLQINAKR